MRTTENGSNCCAHVGCASGGADASPSQAAIPRYTMVLQRMEYLKSKSSLCDDQITSARGNRQRELQETNGVLIQFGTDRGCL
jgi:hypothetical protein